MRRAGLFALTVALGCRGSPWAGPTAVPTSEGLAAPTSEVLTPEDDLLPDVSDDGRFLAVVSEINGNQDVWLRDFAGQSFYPLTQVPADDFDPDIEPGGARRYVFASRRSDAKGDIFRADLASGAKAERLTGAESGDRQPRYSPDARHVYFTTARGTGPEYVDRITVDGKERVRISPGPGFDPEPASDGAHIVYTAPARPPEHPHPHLVLLRLADSATVALTAAGGAQGFARFDPRDPQRLVFVRFADDDDGDGAIDVDDQASLWELRLPKLASLFDERPASLRPFPLTDGSDNELFPAPGPFFLHFTQGATQQDVLRMRSSGMFPRLDDPSGYFALADQVEDVRTKWFALRCVLATAEADGTLAAQARLAIGKLHERRQRNDLATDVLTPLAVDEASPAVQTLRGQARLELLALSVQRLSPTPDNVKQKRRELDAIRTSHPEDERVEAGAAVEAARIEAWSGRPQAAVERLRVVEASYPAFRRLGAEAALLRLELLASALHPEALGAAYAAVARRYSDLRWVVERSAEAIADAHARELGPVDAELRAQALVRVFERYPAPELQAELRERAAQAWLEAGRPRAAAAELEAAVELRSDVLGRARDLARLARTYESVGDSGRAVDAWRRLRAVSSDLPAYAAEARAALTRTNLANAEAAEGGGRLFDALMAYEQVVDNDPQQYLAHRRRLAIGARVGRADNALEVARAQVASDARSPVNHYVLGLALTYADKPDLPAAERSLTKALQLNPQFPEAYLARGWVYEMRELQGLKFFGRFFKGIGDWLSLAFGTGAGTKGGSGYLELAVEDYRTAAQLNPESSAPGLEADILLNLGNAHYRIGQETEDRGNVELAYARYTEALRLGLEFRDARREYVFWERLGRAAAWSEAWADSVTATRRAIAVAQDLGFEDRLPELYGSLSLAYNQAEEPGLARASLSRYTEAVRAEELKGHIAIAVRNRVRATMAGPEGHRADALEEALQELKDGRAVLDEHGVDRGEVPSLWRPLDRNPSRAQFGFDRTSEPAVYLALKEQALRRLGSVSRADRVREARIERSKRIERSVPRRFLFVSSELTALVALRERLGLEVATAVDALLDGRKDDAWTTWDAARSEARGWVGEGYRSTDRLAHATDLARLDALGAEIAIASEDPEHRSRIAGHLAESERLLLNALAPESSTVAAARLDVPFDDRVASVLSSTVALAQTASAALSRSPLDAELRAARAARARQEAARARLTLSSLDLETKASDRPFQDLDLRTAPLVEAIKGLDASVRLAAGAGAGEGTLLAAAALSELAAVTERWGIASDPRPLLAVARRLAEASARFEVLARLRSTKDDDALGCADPRIFAPRTAAWVRQLKEAVAGRDLESAWTAADRLLSSRACVGGLPARASPRHPSDAPLLDELRASWASLQDVRQELFATADPALFPSLSTAMERLRRARARASESASAWGRLRWFGETAALEDQADALSESDVLIAGVVDGEDLHLLWVRSSTSGEVPVNHALAQASASQVKTMIVEAWRGTPNADAFRRAVLDPVGVPTGTRVVWAGWPVGPPVPQTLAGLTLLTNVTAPSVVPILSEDIAVGGGRGLTLTGSDVGATITDVERLDARRVATLRAGTASFAPAYRAFVWSDYELESQAVGAERGRLLAPATESPGLPLDVLDTPTPAIFFGRGSAGPPESLDGLDLALANLGISTGFVLPRLSEDAGRRRFQELAEGAERGTGAAAFTEWTARSLPLPGAAFGVPGLTAEAVDAYAKSELKPAQVAALGSARDGDFVRAAPRLRRWLQLLKAADEPRYIPAVYRALVGLYSSQLRPPDPDRAASVQREFLAYLESTGAPESERAEQRAALANLLSISGQLAEAEAYFEEAFAELETVGEPVALGTAHYHHFRHLQRQTELEAAADELERSITAFEKAGLYGGERWPREAELALSVAGDLYLNRLSDPVRAEEAYRRELKWVRSEEGRITLELDLARVARRSGDFGLADRRAQDAGDRAYYAGFPLLVLEAEIERANAAWSRGEYERSEERCQVSLELVEEERVRIDADPSLDASVLRSRALDQLAVRQVFALSVCGLAAMRLGEDDRAVSRLTRALGLARDLGRDDEIATQWNNLGRVYLEAGRFEAAADAFRSARRIDAERQDVYALAYDDRNLGRALSLLGDPRAEETLLRALAGARQAQDKNNAARSLYALAEHYRLTAQLPRAIERYTELFGADLKGMRDIAWAAAWGFGVVLDAAGRPAEAEVQFARSVAEVRELGRAAPRSSRIGPSRSDPFDAMVQRALNEDRVSAAFDWHEQARTFEVALGLSGRPDLPTAAEEALDAIRTSTVDAEREAAWSELREVLPRVESLLGPSSLERVRRETDQDALVIIPRVLANELVLFVATSSRTFAERRSLARSRLDAHLRRHRRGLRRRTSVDGSLAELGRLLTVPLNDALKTRPDVHVIVPPELRGIAWSALPGPAGPLVETHRVRLGLGPRSVAYRDGIVGGPVEVFAPSRIGFAREEARSIAESFPASLILGAEATGEAWVQSLSRPAPVHFAGHLAPAASLQMSDGRWGFWTLGFGAVGAPLVTVSACALDDAAGPSTMARDLQVAGADTVIVPLVALDDVAAAVVSKHLYRSLSTVPPSEALRRAQLATRQHWPHPGWWGTMAPYVRAPIDSSY